jgi:hypothetical protein
MQRFLIKLNSKEVKETFDLLTTIIENLENKNDPDEFEIHIFNNASNVLEIISLLESGLKEKVRKNINKNKLQRLYERTSNGNYIGTQILFE